MRQSSKPLSNVIILTLLCSLGNSVEDARFWYVKGQRELNQAINASTHNKRLAHNIIVFVGDGMGISTITAARIYKGQLAGRPGEESQLFFEKFPHVALSKTYNTDHQVSDSGSTATALFCGFKTNQRVLGVPASVRKGDCEAARDPRNHPTCMLEWAQEKSLRTGIVTTTRVTHATPASLYSKSADRKWEADDDVRKPCKSIARQLVEDSPGNKLNVIFGGGLQKFKKSTIKDNMDLVNDWSSGQRKQNRRAKVVTNAKELDSVNLDQVDSILGLFSNSHMDYEDQRQNNVGKGRKQPSLAQMTHDAIKVLDRGTTGFFLMVEGGRIDHAHHATMPRRALSETLSLEKAVETAYQMTSSQDTLIIVTADHSHTMTVQGYPKRGGNILGAKLTSSRDGQPYTTLGYTNGPRFEFSDRDGKVRRVNLRGEDTTAWNFQTHTGIPMRSETHGGEDVAIFATGPGSYLFHGVHEESYVAHAVGYAAGIGRYGNKKQR